MALTAQDIIDAALAEVAHFFDPGTTAPPIWVRRINVRQEEIFARATSLNPDYYGICAVAPLVNGAADLRDLTEDPPAPDRIDRIEIDDPGTSEYAAGERVNLVRVDDADVSLPPRMLLRDHVLWGVADDMDGVAKIKVYYARRPTPVRSEDDPIELDGAHSELLVWDLAKYMARRAPGVDAGVRQAAIAFFVAEEEAALALYDAHVQQFASTLQTRFA